MRSILLAPLRALGRFFLVPFQPRTWLNLIHLLLGLPLGILYFALIVAGLAVGIGTLPIVWGVLVLAGFFLLMKWLTGFERFTARALLGVEIGPAAPDAPPARGDWEMVKRHLKNPVTWKSPLYLLLRFPVSLAGFVAGVAGFSLAAALLATAFGLDLSDLRFYWRDLEISADPAAVAFAGALAGLLTFHLLNGLAVVNGRMARRLLGVHRAAVPEAPVASLVTA